MTLQTNFEYFELCAKAFKQNKDVHPATLIDSTQQAQRSYQENLSDASTVDMTQESSRKRRRSIQKQKADREEERYNEKKRWRTEMLANVQELVSAYKRANGLDNN